ncbi:hypothetical protein OAD66_05660 [Bacteroidia bacterium]|nr:hypothetical protein [Bacteroidia bacterium]MDB4107093.1 hypothetical protein [Bacteroidia bacterium]MDB9882602.1 hypothetical protein [Bacteroidia bacterium]
MKNLKKSLFVIMAFAAITFTFTACSKSGKNYADDAAGEEELVEEGTEAIEGAAEGAATDVASWSSDFDELVLNGTGSKTITLEGLGAEESGLSAEGQAQLNYIATALEAN